MAKKNGAIFLVSLEGRIKYLRSYNINYVPNKIRS